MKNAIVSGASGNLGQAVARKFLSGGYNVVGTIIENDPVKIDIDDPKFSTATVDLTNEEAAGRFVSEVIARNGSIDVAVLTVGGFAAGNIEGTSSKDILKQYRLNFETAYHLARPVFVEMMKKNYGRIFLTGSRTGSDMKKSKGMVAYGISKSLIFRLAELMNDEAKGHNIVVSVVSPSTIDTPQNRKSMPDADFTKWVKPEEIAEVIFSHSSKENSIMREIVLNVFGNA